MTLDTNLTKTLIDNDEVNRSSPRCYFVDPAFRINFIPEMQGAGNVVDMLNEGTLTLDIAIKNQQFSVEKRDRLQKGIDQDGYVTVKTNNGLYVVLWDRDKGHRD